MSCNRNDNPWHKWKVLVPILAALALVIAACGAPAADAPTAGPASAAGPTPTAKAGTPVAAPARKPEGTLKFAFSSLAREVLDPYRDTGNGSILFSLFFDYLVGSTPDGMDLGTVGGLATKWEQKPDGSGWIFYLRKGVQWDKGYGEVTAEDVKFSVERTDLREGAIISERPSFVAGIKEIVVVDPYTVRIDTNNPFLDLPEMLSRLQHGMGAIYPKKAIEQMGDQQWANNPVSSGPYRMVEHQAGSYFKFEAREDYWGGVPRYKEIYAYNVPEDATRAAMLKRGEVDVAEVTVSQLKELQAAGFKLVEKKDNIEFIGNPHNQWEGALAKREVREALNVALNRQELADKLFEGRARPMNGDMPSFLVGGKDQPVIPYDPGRAKTLLAQAGYPNGFDLSIITRPQTPLPLLSEAMAGYFRAVGINASVKAMDNATATGLWREGKLKDAISPFLGSNRRFYLSGYNAVFDAKAATSLLKDSDPKMQALLQAAMRSRTLDEFGQNHANIQKYARDQFLYVYILHSGYWYAANPKLNTEGWNGGGMSTYAPGWWQFTIQ